MEPETVTIGGADLFDLTAVSMGCTANLRTGRELWYALSIPSRYLLELTEVSTGWTKNL